MSAGDGAHEQDDRQHHQPGRDDRGGEADLALGVQEPAAGGDQHQHERPEQLGEQSAVLEFGIVEVRPRPELERQHMLSPLQVVGHDPGVFLVGAEAHDALIADHPSNPAEAESRLTPRVQRPPMPPAAAACRPTPRVQSGPLPGRGSARRRR